MYPYAKYSLIYIQLWVKRASSPEIIRNKAKEDLNFRQRLLEYIENVASECLPQDVNCNTDWMDIDDTTDAYANDELQVDDQVFQPYLDPDDPNFDILFK